MSKEQQTKLTKIEKIIIEIAGTKLELTPDQAKELRDILIEAIGQGKKDYEEIRKLLDELAKKKEKEYIPVPYPQPYPIYPDPWPWGPRKYWEPIVFASTGPNTGDYICTNGSYSSSANTLQITCKALDVKA